jgi:hypothetical protein
LFKLIFIGGDFSDVSALNVEDAKEWDKFDSTHPSKGTGILSSINVLISGISTYVNDGILEKLNLQSNKNDLVCFLISNFFYFLSEIFKLINSFSSYILTSILWKTIQIY